MEGEFERAVREGDVAAVHEALRRGADVDARDRYGQTGLMIASHRGHADVVWELLERRASLDVTAKYGLSALMLAVIGGHEDVARMLVRAGADPSIRGTGAPGFHGRTAHDLAAERGWPAERLAELRQPPTGEP